MTGCSAWSPAFAARPETARRRQVEDLATVLWLCYPRPQDGGYTMHCQPSSYLS